MGEWVGFSFRGKDLQTQSSSVFMSWVDVFPQCFQCELSEGGELLADDTCQFSEPSEPSKESTLTLMKYQ